MEISYALRRWWVSWIYYRRRNWRDSREREIERECERAEYAAHCMCMRVCVCVFVCASSTPLTVIIQCQNLMSPNCSCWQRRAMKLNAAPCGGNRPEQSTAEGVMGRERESREWKAKGVIELHMQKINNLYRYQDLWIKSLYKKSLPSSSHILFRLSRWKRLEEAISDWYIVLMCMNVFPYTEYIFFKCLESISSNLKKSLNSKTYNIQSIKSDMKIIFSFIERFVNLALTIEILIQLI